jgi:hypothetical protein
MICCGIFIYTSLNFSNTPYHIYNTRIRVIDTVSEFENLSYNKKWGDFSEWYLYKQPNNKPK